MAAAWPDGTPGDQWPACRWCSGTMRAHGDDCPVMDPAVNPALAPGEGRC